MGQQSHQLMSYKGQTPGPTGNLMSRLLLLTLVHIGWQVRWTTKGFMDFDLVGAAGLMAFLACSHMVSSVLVRVIVTLAKALTAIRICWRVLVPRSGPMTRPG
jgi:hypothetical protein